MSSFSASQSDGKLKAHASDMTPLKLCVKYTPPSIALYYTLTSTPEKKYMHSLNIANFITGGVTSAEIYQKLMDKEAVYLNPKVVSKRQIIKLIEQLLGKSKKENERKQNKLSSEPAKDKDKPAANKEAKARAEASPKVNEGEDAGKESGRDERSSYSKQLSIDSSAYTNPVLATNIEDLASVNAESVVVSGTNIQFNAPPSLEKDAKGEAKGKPAKVQAPAQEIVSESAEEREENKPAKSNINIKGKKPEKKVAAADEEEFNPKNVAKKRENKEQELDDQDAEPAKPVEKKQQLAKEAAKEYEAQESGEEDELNNANVEEEDPEEMAKLMNERQYMQRVYEQMLLSTSFSCVYLI